MIRNVWNALVYCNGDRRKDKEFCKVFEFNKLKIPSVIYYSHGVMGDGNIRVQCREQYIPSIYELLEDGNVNQIYYPFDYFFEFNVHFEYKGYVFNFVSGDPNSATMTKPDGTVSDFVPGKPNSATMTEPDGTIWKCIYGHAANIKTMDII